MTFQNHLGLKLTEKEANRLWSETISGLMKSLSIEDIDQIGTTISNRITQELQSLDSKPIQDED